LSAVIARVSFLSEKPGVLMYHSFDTAGWRFGEDPEVFKKQLQHLLKTKTIVPFSDIVEYAQGNKTINENSVAITVDDGYEDTYHVLFPLAKQYSVPFTIFLTSDLRPRDFFGNIARPTIGQLSEMAASGLVSIQTHGHTHEKFPVIANSQNLIKEEVEECESVIKTITGGDKPQYAAYPAGVYDQTAIDMLKKRGYLAACSTHSGFVEVGDDLFRLNRIEVGRRIPFSLFKLRLTPALTVYNKLIRVFK